MSRFKILLLSSLAVMVVSSVAASTASAELNGPWWKHIVGGQQVKYEQNKEQALKASNENQGKFKLFSKGNPVLGNITIECKKATSNGNIWNGLKQGKDNATAIFEECESKGTVAGVCKGVEISHTEVYSELMWKYKGVASELHEVGQQKIYDAFAPTEEPKEGKAKYVTITFPEGCVGHGTLFEVTANGTEANFVDQFNVNHRIVWGTAALVEPQNTDVTKGFLHWVLPNVTELHHQETPIRAKLEFAGHAAELEGTFAIELNNGEAFGAFNQ